MEPESQRHQGLLGPVATGWRKWKGLFLLLLFIKGAFIFLTSDYTASLQRLARGDWKDQLKIIASVNNDELLIAEVALNYNKGLGFVSANEGKRRNYPYDFTAYRPTYPVYFHIVLMKVFHAFFPGKTLVIDWNTPYFLLYGGLLIITSFLLFALSMFYFKAIADQLLSEKFSRVALVAYVLYPSVLLFIGNLANYESLVTSMLIILFALILKGIHYRLTWPENITIVSFTIFSSLFRPQTNFIFIFLFGACLLMAFLKRKKEPFVIRQVAAFSAIIVACGIAFNIPVLIKNHRLFGSYTLSTTGFNFGLGHNPFARGGWCPACLVDSSNSYYQYVRNEIKDYDQLDEFHKAAGHQALAMSWIKENPLAEMRLAVRKVAIYFLPYNNDNNKFNLFNMLVHAGTLLFCCLFLANMLFRKKMNSDYLLLLMPLVGSLAVTVLFHAGYRWRYYAEPFMVLYAVIVVQALYKKLEERRARNKTPGLAV